MKRKKLFKISILSIAFVAILTFVMYSKARLNEQKEETSAREFAHQLADTGQIWMLVGRTSDGDKIVCRVLELRSTKQYQFEIKRGYYLSDTYLSMKPYATFGLAFGEPPKGVRKEARPEYFLVPVDVPTSRMVTTRQ
jgi:hypothetical protein